MYWFAVRREVIYAILSSNTSNAELDKYFLISTGFLCCSAFIWREVLPPFSLINSNSLSLSTKAGTSEKFSVNTAVYNAAAIESVVFISTLPKFRLLVLTFVIETLFCGAMFM